MTTNRSSRNKTSRTGGTVGRHRREPTPGVVRTQAKRRIIGSALVLASLGTVAAATSGHAFDGTAHANAHPQVSHDVATAWMY
jgi:hypothetical protein